MNKKSVLILLVILIISCTTTSLATFTTGKGEHTFKAEIFRPDPQLTLESFLVGFGINKTTSVNFKLTNPDDSEQPLDFIAPYYKNMNGSKNENTGETNKNNFYASGPILDITCQYIPQHPLFVTSNSLNAIQVGLRNLRGDSKDPDDTVTENVDRTYLMIGVISRSRWEDHNIFSDLNFTTDFEHSSWGIDTEVGMEFKLKDNFRAQISYKYMGTTAGSASGISLGFRANY